MLAVLKALRKKRKKESKPSRWSYIPYLCTFGNAIFGFIAVTQALQGNFIAAAYCIGFAAFMDACDGRLARAFGSSSYLGGELDSLCDAISFCFAPIIVLYSFYNFQVNFALLGVLAFYLCAGLFRLAKFNTQDSSSSFIGLPTTVSGSFIASFVLYHKWLAMNSFSFLLLPQSIGIILIVLSILMVSPIPFPTLKNYSFKFPYNYIISVVSVCALLFCFTRTYPVFLILVCSYILTAFCWWMVDNSKHWLKKVR